MSDSVTLGIKITSDGKTAKAEIQSISAETDKLSSSANKAARSTDSLGSSLKSTAGDAARLVGAMAGFTAAGIVTGIVRATDAMALMDSRIKLVTNSTEQFRLVQQQLYIQSQNVGTSVEAQADLYAKLARATEGSGRSARDLLSITDIISKNLAISGTSAGEAAGAMLQFGQAAGGGVVRAEEFNSMLEGMPTLIQGIAKSLGITIAELRNLVNAGRLTSDQFLDAILQMREGTSEQMSQIADTVEKSAARMGNSLLKFGGYIGQMTGISKLFIETLNDISHAMDRASGLTDTRSDLVSDIESARKRLTELQEGFRTKDLFGVTPNAIKNAEQKLKDTTNALERFDISVNVAKQHTDPLAEGFGKVSNSLEKVGKDADATRAQIAKVAEQMKVPVAFALGIAKQESQFNQSAVSNKGAVGIFQLMDETAKGLKVNSRDALDNIKGGVTYLAQLLDKYDGSLKKTAAAYNAGPGAVDRAGGVPNIQETQNFVQRVLANTRDYAQQYPNGIKLFDAKEDQADLAKLRADFDSMIQAQNAAAKARETIAKSEKATQIQLLEIQQKAFEQYSKDAAGDLSGQGKLAFQQQAAQQQIELIKKATGLKQEAIDIEARYAQAELASINQQIAARDRLNLKDVEFARLLDARRQKEADIASLAQQRQAIEIQGSGQEVAAAAQAANAERQITDEILNAQQARESYIQTIKDQITAIETGNNAISEEARLTQLTQGLTADQAETFKQQARALREYRDAVKAAADAKGDGEQSVRDSTQIAQRAAQNFVQMMQQAAINLEKAFGKVGEAIGGIGVAIAQANDYSVNFQATLQNQLKDIDRLQQSGKLTPDEADIQRQTAASHAQTQELANQFQMWSSVTGAATGFFEKGSQGYDTLSNASKAFAIAEAATVAIETAQKAILAIVNQASAGDVYTAIPRMVAMAAALASIGVAVASPSGGATGAVARTPWQSSGTTVFGGGQDDKSESISKAIELTAKNSSTDLSYSAEMVRSLRNIELALAGVTNSVIRSVGSLSGLSGAAIPALKQPIGPTQGLSKLLFGPLSFTDFASKYLGGFLDKILINVTRKISDWGIGAFPQTLTQILSEGFQGKTFTDITTTTKVLFIKVASSTKTYIGDMASETEKQFTLAITSIADSIREAGKAFGISADEFNRRVGDFVITFDTKSLKGLKGDELQKAIEQQFSRIADQLAGALGVQGFEDFQRAGEGSYETLIRLADGINQANGRLAELGINAIKYTEVQFKQGDVASEIVRQSIVAFEGIESGIGKFIDAAVGSADDLIQTYLDLLSIRDQMKGAGLHFEDLSRAMTEAAGGAAKLRDALSSFSQNFLSTGEQYAQSLTTLARQFGNLGLTVPASKEAFKELIYSIDTSTEAGQKLFAQLISLSDAFAKAADQAAELEKKYRQYLDPGSAWKDTLQQVIDDFKSIMDAKLGTIEADYANKASIAKAEANAPLQNSVDYLQGYVAQRNNEVSQNFAYLQQVTDRIAQLQDLISRFSGQKGAAGYVAAWEKELDGLNKMADTLRADIGAKTEEINRINQEIADLQQQMADNANAIDAELNAQKLAALQAEKSALIKQQAKAIAQTLEDMWRQIADAIRSAQASLAKQIAELQGGTAPTEFATAARKSAFKDLRDYIKDPNHDATTAIGKITDTQSAILDEYNAKLAELQAKQQAKIDRQVKQRQAQLDAEIQAINDAADKQIQAVNDALEATLEGISEYYDAQREALQESLKAQEDAINKDLEFKIKQQQKVNDAALKGLQDQLSAAQALKSAYQQVADYAQKLKIGSLSSLSPESKLYESQGQFNTLLAKVLAGGDAADVGKLTSAADDYLNAAKSYYGSGTQYTDIYSAVQAAMQQVGGLNAPDTDSIQAHIDDLREQQEAQLQALRDAAQEQIEQLRKNEQAAEKALQKQQQAAEKAARQNAQDQIDAIRERADKQIEHAQRIAEKEIEAIREGNTNPAIEALKQRTIEKLQRLQELLEKERQRALEQAQEQIDYAAKQVQISKHMLNQLRKIAEKMLAPVEGYASGGYPGIGRDVIVGERGPEVARFLAPVRIYPNGQLPERPNQSGGPADSALTERLDAVIRELRALVTTQAAANPKLVTSLEALSKSAAAKLRLETIKPISVAG